MRNFKLYYDSFKSDSELFESVFDSNYDRGYYGSVSKASIKKSQYDWFMKFKAMIEEKDTHGLSLVLIESENNKVTKEFFTRLTGIDLNRKSEKDIKQYISEICNIVDDEKKKHLLQDWKRFINMEVSQIKVVNKESKTYYSRMSEIVKKKACDLMEEEYVWIDKHISMLKKLKNTKSELRDEEGKPTRKLEMLKQLGFDPEK